jgi:hypothetical protein
MAGATESICASAIWCDRSNGFLVCASAQAAAMFDEEQVSEHDYLGVVDALTGFLYRGSIKRRHP